MVRVSVFVRTIGRPGTIGSGEEGEKERDRKRERERGTVSEHAPIAIISDGSALLNAFGICPRRTNQQACWTPRGARRETCVGRGWLCQGRAGIRR